MKIIDIANDHSSARRFLTVDADMAHDPQATAFYTKNGFIANVGTGGKKSKIISMRKDILM